MVEIERRALIAAAIGLAGTSAARAQWGGPPTPFAGRADEPRWPARERIALWPAGAPGAPNPLPRQDWTMNGPPGDRQLWVRGVATPDIAVFRPARPDGSAVLVIPGGGYGMVSVQNEGIEVANWLTPHGITVFVLSYRLPGEGWANRDTVPLSDAQRAMRLLRARAPALGIDPAKLGALGFSAGGHLCADLAVSHDEPVYRPIDEADRLPARPAFVGLGYPVATLAAREGHKGSREALLGPDPSPALVEKRSPLVHVGRETPPSFLIHAVDDGTVPVENSIDWLTACHRAKVPVEAHIIERGGHGFGTRLPESNPGHLWPDLFMTWLRMHIGQA